MQYSFNTVEPTRILRFIIKTSLVNEFWSSINFVGLRTRKEEAVRVSKSIAKEDAVGHV